MEKILFLANSHHVSNEWFKFIKKKFRSSYPIYYGDLINQFGYLHFQNIFKYKLEQGYKKILIDPNFNLNIYDLNKIKKKYKLKIVLLTCDDEYLFDKQTVFFSKISDFILTSDYVSYLRLKQMNKAAGLFHEPLTFDKSISLSKKFDISFVGTLDKPGRKLFLKKLQKKFNICIFDTSKKKISQYEIKKIYKQSKINLNFSNVSNSDFHITKDFKINGFKGRVGQIFSNKSFCLSEYSLGLSKLFDFKPSIFFKSEKDLVKKVSFFLNHSAERNKAIKKSSILLKKNCSSAEFTKKIRKSFKFKSDNSSYYNKYHSIFDENYLSYFFVSNLNSSLRIFFQRPLHSFLNFFYIFLVTILLAFKIKNINIIIFIIRTISLILQKINAKLSS